MIVLLSCLGNLQESNAQATSSTGGLGSDSVLVSYDDLRVANSKMIELKYEKKINESLNSIVRNDSIIINNNKRELYKTEKKLKKVKRQRNIFGGSTIIAIFAFIIAIV